jgi:hypothetical protein
MRCTATRARAHLPPHFEALELKDFNASAVTPTQDPDGFPPDAGSHDQDTDRDAAARGRGDGGGGGQPQRVPRWADAYYFGIEDLYEVVKLMVDELHACRQRFYEDQPQAGN